MPGNSSTTKSCNPCKKCYSDVNPHTGATERDALCHLIQMDYELRNMDGSGNNKKNTI